MWKSVLAGVILENIETLEHFQTLKDKKKHTIENIFQFITGVITNFPWYFFIPIKILANIIGLLCLITTGHKLDLLSPEKRSDFLRRVKSIPFFDMLNRLVRSMAFLKLFDSFPLSTDYKR